MSKYLIIPLYLFITAPTVSAQNCFSESISATTPLSRFSDNNDGTVSDSVTGLTWKRCAEGMTWDDATCTGNSAYLTWQQALQQTSTVNTSGGYAGHTDWRVPNIKELKSIVERQCNSPAINLLIFPNTSMSHVWSSSQVSDFPDSAWSVSFSLGDDYWNDRFYSFAVRLVRGGQ